MPFQQLNNSDLENFKRYLESWGKLELSENNFEDIIRQQGLDKYAQATNLVWELVGPPDLNNKGHLAFLSAALNNLKDPDGWKNLNLPEQGVILQLLSGGINASNREIKAEKDLNNTIKVGAEGASIALAIRSPLSALGFKAIGYVFGRLEGSLALKQGIDEEILKYFSDELFFARDGAKKELLPRGLELSKTGQEYIAQKRRDNEDTKKFNPLMVKIAPEQSEAKNQALEGTRQQAMPLQNQPDQFDLQHVELNPTTLDKLQKFAESTLESACDFQKQVTLAKQANKPLRELLEIAASIANLAYQVIHTPKTDNRYKKASKALQQQLDIANKISGLKLEVIDSDKYVNHSLPQLHNTISQRLTEGLALSLYQAGEEYKRVIADINELRKLQVNESQKQDKYKESKKDIVQVEKKITDKIAHIKSNRFLSYAAQGLVIASLFNKSPDMQLFLGAANSIFGIFTQRDQRRQEKKFNKLQSQIHHYEAIKHCYDVLLEKSKGNDAAIKSRIDYLEQYTKQFVDLVEPDQYIANLKQSKAEKVKGVRKNLIDLQKTKRELTQEINELVIKKRDAKSKNEIKAIQEQINALGEQRKLIEEHEKDQNKNLDSLDNGDNEFDKAIADEENVLKIRRWWFEKNNIFTGLSEDEKKVLKKLLSIRHLCSQYYNTALADHQHRTEVYHGFTQGISQLWHSFDLFFQGGSPTSQRYAEVGLWVDRTLTLATKGKDLYFSLDFYISHSLSKLKIDGFSSFGWLQFLKEIINPSFSIAAQVVSFVAFCCGLRAKTDQEVLLDAFKQLNDNLGQVSKNLHAHLAQGFELTAHHLQNIHEILVNGFDFTKTGFLRLETVSRNIQSNVQLLKHQRYEQNIRDVRVKVKSKTETNEEVIYHPNTTMNKVALLVLAIRHATDEQYYCAAIQTEPQYLYKAVEPLYFVLELIRFLEISVKNLPNFSILYSSIFAVNTLLRKEQTKLNEQERETVLQYTQEVNNNYLQNWKELLRHLNQKDWLVLLLQKMNENAKTLFVDISQFSAKPRTRSIEHYQRVMQDMLGTSFVGCNKFYFAKAVEEVSSLIESQWKKFKNSPDFPNDPLSLISRNRMIDHMRTVNTDAFQALSTIFSFGIRQPRRYSEETIAAIKTEEFHLESYESLRELGEKFRVLCYLDHNGLQKVFDSSQFEKKGTEFQRSFIRLVIAPPSTPALFIGEQQIPNAFPVENPVPPVSVSRTMGLKVLHPGLKKGEFPEQKSYDLGTKQLLNTYAVALQRFLDPQSLIDSNHPLYVGSAERKVDVSDSVLVESEDENGVPLLLPKFYINQLQERVGLDKVPLFLNHLALRYRFKSVKKENQENQFYQLTLIYEIIDSNNNAYQVITVQVAEFDCNTVNAFKKVVFEKNGQRCVLNKDEFLLTALYGNKLPGEGTYDLNNHGIICPNEIQFIGLYKILSFLGCCVYLKYDSRLYSEQTAVDLSKWMKLAVTSKVPIDPSPNTLNRLLKSFSEIRKTFISQGVDYARYQQAVASQQAHYLEHITNNQKWSEAYKKYCHAYEMLAVACKLTSVPHYHTVAMYLEQDLGLRHPYALNILAQNHPALFVSCLKQLSKLVISEQQIGVFFNKISGFKSKLSDGVEELSFMLKQFEDNITAEHQSFNPQAIKHFDLEDNSHDDLVAHFQLQTHDPIWQAQLALSDAHSNTNALEEKEAKEQKHSPKSFHANVNMPSHTAQKFIFLSGKIDSSVYLDACNKDKLNPKHTIYIFPGNPDHHQPKITFYSKKSGAGLAGVAEKLSHIGISTLSLPTRDTDQINCEMPIADLWKAVGSGYSLALPVRPHQNTEYFDSAIGDTNCEPNFWGGVVNNPNKMLANEYCAQLEILKRFVNSDDNVKQMLFKSGQVKDFYKDAYLEGQKLKYFDWEVCNYPNKNVVNAVLIQSVARAGVAGSRGGDSVRPQQQNNTPPIFAQARP